MKKVLSIRINDETLERLKKEYEKEKNKRKPYIFTYARFINIILEEGIYHHKKVNKFKKLDK